MTLGNRMRFHLPGWKRPLECLVLVLLFGFRQLGATPQAGDPSKSPLQIIQLSVGQGDAALVITPEGKRVLIDAGPTETSILAHLRQFKIDTIDLLVASHNHADHIGGIPGVLGAVVVRAYLDNGIPHTTNIYARTLAAVEAEPGLQYLQATDRVIDLGAVKIRVLPPSQLDNSQNNNSVGLLLTYGLFSALFTGDSEQMELRSWLANSLLPKVTLHKAAHHGSWNGVTDEARGALSPKVVLISVGPNSYGHPAPEVEEGWRTVGASVYRTDRNGTITVLALSDGKFRVVTADTTKETPDR